MSEPLKVLLVEDHELNRDMLSRRLTQRGFIVVLAEDGRQAIVQAAQEQPDVILMDMSLPLLDGWEATRLLRQNASTAAIPVIALTAHALGEEQARALEAGCAAFETKPVDFPRLLAVIARLTGRPA
ncbi:MAG: response regulator [Acidobacteria bacterium]|jgi:two-component system cell cycle response regulator DivK|nr:response regulator [Acidobacteriota bacterium]